MLKMSSHFGYRRMKIVVSPLVLVGFALYASAAIAAEDSIFMRKMADGIVELSNIPGDSNFELLLAAPPPAVSGLQASRSTTPDKYGIKSTRDNKATERAALYRELIADIAKQSDIDPRLLHAVITVESGYDAEAVSAKGAIGLMQLMPGTARRYGVRNSHDPAQNLLGGASYLRDLLKMFNNDLGLALAAYNAGENSVIRFGNRIPPYRETTAYVPKVMGIYEKLGKTIY
jgi:soluble lytic murein transglycosylase-like protein